MIDNLVEKQTSKIAFLFVSFVVIAGGYVNQVLPCQTQNFLKNDVYAKHVIGFLISFIFIMLEGGWSFDMETQNKADVSWADGNALDSLVFAGILYTTFLFSAKMRLVPNIILYSLLFILYINNSQRLYWHKRDIIDNKQNTKMIRYNEIIIGLCVATFLYGVRDYFLYKKSKIPDSFSLKSFVIGYNKCSTNI